MGSYYVMELSRSEGYELSVQGLNKAETNREADESVTVISSGSAWVKNGLSDHNSMEADGSWNDLPSNRMMQKMAMILQLQAIRSIRGFTV